MDYKLQMKHPNWVQKRVEILRLDNFNCKICHSLDNLEVHHITYKSGALAWHYPNNMLVTLCKKCHQLEHDNKATKNTNRISQWINILSKPNRR